MALEDEENIALFRFDNICFSPVIFALRCVRHVYEPLSFLYTQLLPTLDIYTWTEEHVVSINLSPLIYLRVFLAALLIELTCCHFIFFIFFCSVFLDAADIWRR